MRTRDSSLDLLRTTAIAMVVIYHIAQRWPVPLPAVTAFTNYGAYGVDLFFVLSGWLIGGLLWREQSQFGNVEIGRFICRRALRTVPPYLVALAISYLGVFLTRHERFDWGYLIFLQNYYARIPYFLVSWSLCVEEHFYLIMPLVALTLTRWSPRFHFSLLIVAFLPLLFRVLEADHSAANIFGYHDTATHLRYEGLLLGVWASFVQQRRPQVWERIRRYAPGAVVAALGGVIACAFLPERWRYVLTYSAIALFFLWTLILVVGRHLLFPSATRVIFWIASASYSIYLTQAFTLDLALRAATKMPIAWVQLLVITSSIALSGFGF